MSVPEIVCGVILLICAVAIIFLTLSQKTSSGIGGVIGGDSAQMARGARNTNSQMVKYTKIAGIAFCVITLLVSVISVRLG